MLGAHDNHFYGFAVGKASGANPNITENVHFVAMDTESFIDEAYMSPAQVRAFGLGLGIGIVVDFDVVITVRLVLTFVAMSIRTRQ